MPDRKTSFAGRGLTWVSGHGVLWVADHIFDYVLYPLAIVTLGLAWGTVAMMTASLVICVVLLKFYNEVGRDLLGFESLKTAGGKASDWLRRKLPFLPQSLFRIVLFLYTSIRHDPFTCIVLMRPQHNFTMSRSDIWTFLASVAVGNICWALVVWLGIHSVEQLVREI